MIDRRKSLWAIIKRSSLADNYGDTFVKNILAEGGDAMSGECFFVKEVFK